MKAEQQIELQKKLREKMMPLPDFAVDYLYLLENSKQIRTRIEYAKDMQMFFEFLLQSHKCVKPKIQDISVTDLEHLRERDLIDFFDYLTSYTRTYLSSANVEQEKKEVVQEFTNSEQGKARKLATLRKLFAYLFKKRLLTKDITKNIEIKVPAKAKINHRLSEEEMERFFSTIIDDYYIENQRQLKFHQKLKFRDYVMVHILAYTGIRISELVSLDIEDIKLSKNTFIVTRKGGDEEIIYMPEVIVEDVKEYVKQRKLVTNVVPKDKNALFISLHHKRIDPKTVRAMLEKYRERCGIETKITPHVFRRTFGTDFYNKSGDMYLTAQVLGHSSAETTRRFYADPSEERVSKSMRNFQYGKKKEVKPTNKLVKMAQKLGMTVEELLAEIET